MEFNISAFPWVLDLETTDSMVPERVCDGILDVLSAWEGGCLDIEKNDLRAIALVPELIDLYQSALDTPRSKRTQKLNDSIDRLEKRFGVIDEELKEYA